MYEQTHKTYSCLHAGVKKSELLTCMVHGPWFSHQTHLSITCTATGIVLCKKIFRFCEII